MFEFHDRQTFKTFRGLFDRGEDEACPPDYLLECENAQFEKDGVKTRQTFDQVGLTFPIAGDLADIFPIATDDGSLKYIISENIGNWYYWDGTSSIGILSLPGLSGKFSAVQIKTRIYFVPINSVSAQNVYVFDTSWSVARQAGGVAPAGTVTAAVAAAGNIERGDHLIGVVFETNTGFITSIGALALATVDGTQKLNLTTIPTGTSEVTKRHIVATKALYNYDGNPSAQEYFFVPNGTINDNVTTSLAGVNFYDSELVDSADKYVNQLSRIPQCRRLTLYNGRLVAVAPTADRNTLYVSAVNEPESIDAVDGIVSSAPATYRGIEDVGECRGNLYIFRDTSTQVTQDNGDNPSSWAVETVDKAQGIRTNTDVDLPSTAIGFSGQQPVTIDDNLLVLTKDSLRLFNGTFSMDLTYAIRDKIQALGSACVCISSTQKFILIGTPTLAYFGDYSEGLSSDKIKWAKWTMPTFGSFFASGLYPFVSNAASGKIYYLLQKRAIASDSGTDAVDNCLGATANVQAILRFPFIIPSSGNLYQWNEIIVHGSTGANLSSIALVPTIYGLDSVRALALSGFTSPALGKSLRRWFNFVDEAASIRLVAQVANPTAIYIKSVQVAFKLLWLVRPR